MGTLAQDIPNVPRPSTWLWEFLKHELAPYPGRALTVARMVLAVTLVMIICNTFRIPYAFLGGIYALLISRESPRATLSSAGTVLLLAATGVAYIIVSVQFVISVPLLHFLWIIGSLFLAFYALRVITNYGAFVAFALVVSIAVTIWDRHVSGGTNVADTLWLSLVAFIAVAVTSGVELAFGRMRPGDDIVVPVADRLAAIHSVLTCYSEGRLLDQATEEKVIRLGVLGTSTLRRALRRSDYSPQYRAQMSSVVALVGTLVDITTALTQLSFEPSSIDQEHLRNLAVAVANVRSDLMYRRIPGSILVNTEDERHRVPLLREMENTVALIPQAFAGSRSIDEYQSRSEEMPRSRLIAADAFVNPEHFRFALKGCFAVSACYVIYNSIDWPGMGVPVMLTCFLTAVSTIGASRQRQILRFAGFVVGGIVIGMGAQVFILPYLDSIAGFTVLFILVTALAAWFMTSSPRLSFFGLQLGAVFFVINMQKFARETSLSVARDRVAGVFLGLLMMWLIFDQLWSAPASVEMRRVFISTLRLLAQFAREPVSSDIRSAIHRTSALRDTINTKFDNVRSLADGVLLEFGPSRRRDLALRDRIRRWQPQLRALFIMRGTSLNYRLQLPGFVLPDSVIVSLQAYDECSAQMLENIADRMEGKTSQVRPVSADSSALLGKTLESCRADESRLSLSEHGATFVPLLRQIDRLTSRLAKQIAMEIDRPD
ncbi:MAG: FUSC family protein [Bryobacteraceae bacterium]